MGTVPSPTRAASVRSKDPAGTPAVAFISEYVGGVSGERLRTPVIFSLLFMGVLSCSMLMRSRNSGGGRWPVGRDAAPMGDAPDRASPRYVVEADGTPSPPPARTRGVPPPGYCGLRLSLRRLPLSANVRSRCTGRTRIRSCRGCSEGKSRLIFFRLIRLFRRVPHDPPGGGDCVGVGPRQRTPRHRRPCCFCRQHSRFS